MVKKVLLASSSLLALPTYRALQSRSDLQIVGILSTPDRPKGRHGTPSPNELVEFLQGADAPIWKPDTAAEILATVRETKPDLVIVIAYGRLIRREALESVPLGWINLHFSLLPKFRGAAPVQRAILAGDENFGVTVFKLDEGMDTGPILVRRRVEVSAEMVASEILQRLAEEGSISVLEAVDSLLAGGSSETQTGESSLAPKISKHELRLDLNRSRLEVLRQVRAFTKVPGLWFSYKGRRHRVTAAKGSDQSISLAHIAHIDGSAVIGIKEGSLEILTIVPEGKREMSGSEWVRGLHLAEGAVSEDGIDS